MQKIMRDKDSTLTDTERLDLAKEVGDVLWYVALTARELGLTLQDVATLNLEKLMSRLQRGTLKGKGDER